MNKYAKLEPKVKKVVRAVPIPPSTPAVVIPAANSIPKSDEFGLLNTGWLPNYGTNHFTILTYPTAPSSPPYNTPYMITPSISASITTDPATISPATNVDVTFSAPVNPVTVTNAGNGSGSFEFFNTTTGLYVPGILSTADNTTFTFNPTSDYSIDDVVEVRIALTVATPAPILVYDGVILSFTVLTPDTEAPVITGFVADDNVEAPVAITTFTATDNIGVTGYWIGETATEPSLSDPGWSSTAQTEYNTASTGSVTLYARVRDAFGNISTASSQAITILASLRLDPDAAGTGIVLTNNNLTASNGGGSVTGWPTVLATSGVSTGLRYFEFSIAAGDPNNGVIGLAPATDNLDYWPGYSAASWGLSFYDPAFQHNRIGANPPDPTGAFQISGLERIGILWDADTGKLWFKKGSAAAPATFDPLVDTPKYTGVTGTLYPAVACYLDGSYTIHGRSWVNNVPAGAVPYV